MRAVPPRLFPLLLLCLLGCAVAQPSPVAPGPALAPEPPTALVMPPAPEAELLPEPEGMLPELRALALARQVLAREAPRIDEDAREAVARVLADASQELGVDVLLSIALITQESRFNPRARGPRGSIGLMQLRPFVARDVAARHGLPWKGQRTLFDPAHNVRLGTLYLAEMLDLFGRTDHALAAYNMGPYRLRRLLRRGPIARTSFSERVRGHYDLLVDRYAPPDSVAWGG